MMINKGEAKERESKQGKGQGAPQQNKPCRIKISPLVPWQEGVVRI
jgi:hypothetical protein